MKFTDKFVLVPHERYERFQHLLKNPHFDKETEKDSVQQGGALESSPPTRKEKDNTQISPIKQRDESTKNTSEQVISPSLLIRKRTVQKKPKRPSTLPKYPLPPPGIPDKPNNIHFKWISLFK